MVNATMTITGVYDGTMRRFAGAGNLGTSSQSESQDPIFHLVEGATLQNVILGNPAADGVHCDGNCTLKNVWWEDVGEDAATLKGTSPTQVMTIDGGGAQKASDKVFQHNGPGTMIIQQLLRAGLRQALSIVRQLHDAVRAPRAAAERHGGAERHDVRPRRRQHELQRHRDVQAASS